MFRVPDFKQMKMFSVLFIICVHTDVKVTPVDGQDLDIEVEGNTTVKIPGNAFGVGKYSVTDVVR